jgi:2-polyprenyl-3-methyl-5-hydroxy-6-metoxy-1,4-benzoquinol methylase
MVSGIRTKVVPHCLLCGCEGAQFYRGLQDRLCDVPGSWDSSRCPNCGLLWLNPRPISADISKCYRSHYFTHEATEPQSLGTSTVKRRVRMMALGSSFGYEHLGLQDRFAYLVGRTITIVPALRKKVTMGLGAKLLHYRGRGQLLDIGCGNGSYMTLMRELGWNAVGVEVDEIAANIARSHGLCVHSGTLDQAPFEKGFFDAITMSHVLEHVPDPARFLTRAAEFLRPGGEMVIVTPNLRSLGHRLFRKDWYALDPPRHLVLFAPENLRQLCNDLGIFRRVRVNTTSRISRKILYKFVSVRKTGRFNNQPQTASIQPIWTQPMAALFEIIEAVLNPLVHWGEEIECVAIKD